VRKVVLTWAAEEPARARSDKDSDVRIVFQWKRID
jgi:hypothetical protein